MIPESVVYVAYVVLVAVGVAFCTALLAGTYLIWQGIRTFRNLREDKPSMKEFMYGGHTNQFTLGDLLK